MSSSPQPSSPFLTASPARTSTASVAGAARAPPRPSSQQTNELVGAEMLRLRVVRTPSGPSQLGRPLYDDGGGRGIATSANESTWGVRPRVQNSLGGIEEELTKAERQLATLRETLKRLHGESAAHDAALHEMGLRAKEIMNRPKTWRGGSKSSDAAELEALRAEMRARTEAMSRSVEAMRSVSAQATELTKRQQDLSKVRADLVARDDQGGSPLLDTEGRVPTTAPPPRDVIDEAPRPAFGRGPRSSRKRPE